MFFAKYFFEYFRNLFSNVNVFEYWWFISLPRYSTFPSFELRSWDIRICLKSNIAAKLTPNTAKIDENGVWPFKYP